MTRAISSSNCCQVTYPSTQLTLAQDQAQILYFLTGWLLSSALTRVHRGRTLRPISCSFVNRHSYRDAEQFVRTHLELRGLEAEVSSWDVVWRGARLAYPDAAFYEFVLALESGYAHSLANPALFAMYPGDLPKAILEVVSSSMTVRCKFQQCVDSVDVEMRGNDAQLQSVAGVFSELFHFFMSKWRNMHMADIAKRLSKVQAIVKRDKDTRAMRDRLIDSDQQALRDMLHSVRKKQHRRLRLSQQRTKRRGVSSLRVRSDARPSQG